MIEKLSASVRDIVLAGVAAFVGALAVLFATPVGDVTLPGLKAAAVGAAYAALRAVVGAIAVKLAK